MKSFSSLVLDLLFPKRCVYCKRFGAFFCQNCIQKLQKVGEICPVCERPSFIGETHKFCVTKYSLNGLTSVFCYKEPLKQAIHRFKYPPYLEKLADIFAGLMVNELKNNKGFTLFLENKPVLVPVPLYWFRKRIRGYNQTELLVKALSLKLNVGWNNVLVRNKATKPQSELTYKKRKENVAHIFSINPNYKNNIPANIILVDDIWTTGSTLKSACNILKRNTVKSVWALTLAR